MSKTKLLASLLLAFALLAAQVGSALAAPKLDDPTPITGTVQSITLQTDAAGTTTVLVTISDANGNTSTVTLSVDTAVSLNLVALDASGAPVVNDAAVGTSVTIDPSTVIGGTPTEETGQHPVGSALANFFSSLLGVDYNTIMAAHQDGVGFGVVAQALWMTKALNGDSAVFEAIIQAKQTGDYSGITMPDGSTPTNWGQFRKALLDKKQNLGLIMSGQAGNGGAESAPGGQPIGGRGHGQGNNGNAGNNGNGNGHGRKP